MCISIHYFKVGNLVFNPIICYLFFENAIIYVHKYTPKYLLYKCVKSKGYLIYYIYDHKVYQVNCIMNLFFG